jgi:hypothetical protein
MMTQTSDGQSTIPTIVTQPQNQVGAVISQRSNQRHF